MIPQQRRAKIVEHVTKQGHATVSELCRQFSVSEMTIRRDLAQIEEQGLLQRTYGGAAATEQAFFELSFKAKTLQFSEEKRRIAKTAAGMIKDGEAILLDAGSTTSMIAEHLQNKRITVVTNALNIASTLWNTATIELLIAGGIAKTGSLCLMGPQTEAFFKEVRTDKLFLGVEGVDSEAGLTVPDVIEAHTKRAMVKSAKTVIVVADHSKLGRDTLSTIISITDANCVITGREGNEELIEQLKRYIEVIVV